MSLATWVDRWADDASIAFDFEGASVSYAELATRVDVAAAALRGLGVASGDRVAYCGLNRLELFEALFACARLGSIFLPLNNRLTVAELTMQVTDSDPTVVLVTDGFAPTLTEAAGGRTVVDLDGDGWPVATTTDEVPAAPIADDAPLLMVYTSGTTSTPKGAMLSHDALLHTTLNAIDHQDLTAADCVIAPLPTFHVGGLNIQTLPTLYVGGRVVLMRRFDPAVVLDLIAEHQATQTLLVPAMLSAVAGHPRFADTDISCLNGIQTGSSVVPDRVMAPYFDRGVPVGQVYGATETGPTAVALRYDEADTRRSSCGRAALHTEVRIVRTDLDDGDASIDVADGEDGELWVRGRNVFSGYWNDPDATADAFVDGWYRTGDVGRRDADGYVFISDRVKDMVISGGENIYPAELEGVLTGHPSIAEVAIIGRPDERWGEIPLAVVVSEPDTEPPTLDDLHDWCDERLARFKWPRAITIVEELPHTALGKVQKHVLRAQLAE